MTNTPPFEHRPPCHRLPLRLPQWTSQRTATATVILPSGHLNQTNDKDDGTFVARNAVVSTTAIVCDVDLHANTSTATATYAMAEMMDANARRQGEGHGDKTAIAMLLLWRQTATTQVPSE